MERLPPMPIVPVEALLSTTCSDGAFGSSLIGIVDMFGTRAVMMLDSQIVGEEYEVLVRTQRLLLTFFTYCCERKGVILIRTQPPTSFLA